VARAPGLLGVAVAGLALVAGLAGCGRQTVQTVKTTPPPIAAPLATSTEAGGGTWATLPMGHPGDSLNTFWQLFYRPSGSSSWSDQVNATATATNGGLILARGGPSLVVGVRPSNLLHFSPLIATSNGGRTWTNGLTSGLLARPAALAADGAGHALAMVTDGPTTTIEDTAGDLVSWQSLVSLPQLAAAASARSCAPDALAAVGYAAASPVVGVRCARPGVVGLFVQRSGGWQLAALALPGSLAGARIDVLGLQPLDGGLAAVLAASGPSGTSLLAAWSGAGRLNWAVSPALQMPADQHLRSLGPAGGDGLFVLISTSSGSEQLDLVDGPGTRWHSLPPAPNGTATVAFGPAGATTASPGPAQALVAADTVLTVWTLAPGSSGWTKGQVIHVPIQFGSSS
jgi:hypothetical protein